MNIERTLTTQRFFFISEMKSFFIFIASNKISREGKKIYITHLLAIYFVTKFFV